MTESPQESPAQAVTAMVDHVLALAATWTTWDGTPAHVDDRVYTPHKAIRRVADHPVPRQATFAPSQRPARSPKLFEQGGPPLAAQLDHAPGDGWTFRELARPLAGSTYYADAVGDLS